MMQATFGAVVGMNPVVPSVRYLAYETAECADCGADTALDELLDCDGDMLCYDCAVECEKCGCVVRRDDACSNDDGEYFCESCYDDNYVHCDGCGCEVSRDDARRADGNDYCEECFYERYEVCAACGETVHRDYAVYDEHSGETYCEDCAPARGSDSDREWHVGTFKPNRLYRKIRSHRSFGIELETHNCEGHADLEGSTCFGAKYDGSISGKEFVSPVLSSDAGLDVIADFCAEANSRGWEVNSDCGTHIHLDARDLSVAQLKSVAYAYSKTYAAWGAFVDRNRRNNHYCKRHTYCRDELERIFDETGWEGFCNRDRYCWINFAAYNEHGSIEVRLHGGTLDATKACNWIKAHARFMDVARNLTFAEIDAKFGDTVQSAFDGLSECWDDAELTEFYAVRARKFGTTLNIGTPAIC